MAIFQYHFPGNVVFAASPVFKLLSLLSVLLGWWKNELNSSLLCSWLKTRQLGGTAGGDIDSLWGVKDFGPTCRNSQYTCCVFHVIKIATTRIIWTNYSSSLTWNNKHNFGVISLNHSLQSLVATWGRYNLPILFEIRWEGLGDPLFVRKTLKHLQKAIK